MRKAIGRWLLVAALALLLLSGCGKNQDTPVGTQPQAEADAWYATGKSAAEGASDLVLTYSLEQNRKVGQEQFTQNVSGSASYQGYGRKGMTALVEETLDFGYYRCSYKQAFCDGKAYITANDSHFWSKQTPEEFTGRQLPPVLLTPSLYASVTYGAEPGTVLFAEPRDMESWVGEGQLLEASGKALLTQEGQLLESSYYVRYEKGAAEYTLSVTVKLSMPQQLDLSGVRSSLPENSVWLSDPEVPRLLIQVVADVYGAQQISCVLTETITSEAVPLSYERNTQLDLSGRGEKLRAQVINDSEKSNNRGVITQSSQTEQFQNGSYTLSVNGSEPARNGSVTADSMRQYCEDTVLSGLLAVKYLRSATVRKDGRLLYLELEGDLNYAQTLSQHLQQALQVDLDGLAETSEIRHAGAYLALDPDTGLPVSMGMFLEKSHTLGGVRYALRYRLEETLSFSREP